MEFDFELQQPDERLATQGINRNDKRVVCRYWIEGKCQKEDKCRFLHVMDPDRMPECRHGLKCQLGIKCPYKHTPDVEKEECVNYRLGFCSFGPMCKFRHAKHGPDSLPPLSELFVKTYLGDERTRQREESNSSSWRVKECPEYTKDGWCPWFDQCNFAHGEAELRHWRPKTGDKRPRRDAIRYDDYGGGGVTPTPSYAAPVQAQPAAPAPSPGAHHPVDLASLLQRYDSGTAAALNIPGHEGPATYIVLRTLSSETLLLAVKRSEWITPASDALPVLAAAAAAGRPVYLIFSIVNTFGFQGTAEVVGPAEAVNAGHNLEPASAEGAGELVSIPLRWHRTCSLPFPMTASLFVSQGEAAPPLPVARSGDWQELPDRVGRALMLLLFESPPEILDLDGVDASGPFTVLCRTRPADQAALAAEDFGPGVPPLGASAPPPASWKAAPFAAASQSYGASIPRMPPASASVAALSLNIASPTLAYLFEKPADDFIAMLLNGVAPPGAPPPPVLAADAFVRRRSGHMFTSNNVSFPITIAAGVFAAAEDAARGLADVVEGTPVVLLNVHSFMLHGLYLARGPARRDIVPHLIPRMGAGKKAFPLQVQVLQVIEAAPLPTAAYQPFIGGRPQPGTIDAARLHALAVEMLTPLPPQQLLRIAGMLHQLAAVGMPEEGLLKTGAPL